MKKLCFLGVRVDAIQLNEAINELEKKLIIFTPNPEMILEARRNKKLLLALNEGTLMLPDGHGLKFVATMMKIKSKFLRVILYFPALMLFLFWKGFFKNEISEMIHGSDFMSLVVSWAEVNGKSVFFLGGKDEVAKKTAEYFKLSHPLLKIAGYSSENPNKNALKEVKESNAEVILVAYGVPKQEIWIAENFKKIKSCKIIMGVGGSFDFWSGEIRRSPMILRKLGLEWFWRLILQPKTRLKRIWNALVVFPFTCFFSD